MEIKSEKTSQFFEEIKALTFWKRIFGWGKLKNLSYEAYGEFKSLLSALSQISQDNTQTRTTLSVLGKDVDHLRENAGRQGGEISALKEKLTKLEQDNAQLIKENTVLKQTEASRKSDYEKNVATLNTIQERIKEERDQERQQKEKEITDKQNKLKETWANHQTRVKETITSICQRHTVEYVEKVPFKGTPDNTIKIADEYVIFDAKSPANDDLRNFPIYIKTQTESVKKYVKEENVKKDIFLVIPSNTVGVINQFSYDMAEYNVYVITLDALEPIILSLQKIEGYEFAEKLSPEDRDNICRVIGRYAHLSKRRIQVDQFFERLFLGAISKSNSDLPEEILEKAVNYERSEKLNPPLENRSKSISIKELELESQKLRKDAEIKGISLPDSEIKSLSLQTKHSEVIQKGKKQGL